MQVDLGLNNLEVSASQLVAGEPVHVSWHGINRTGALLLGDWVDAVYLSTNETWDISVVKLAEILRTGGLAAGATYSGSADVVIPGKLPGNYRILVRTDVQNQERETNEADNLIASVALPLVVRSLATDGSSVNGALTPTDRADYYAITLGSGESLNLRLTTATVGTRAELYVSYAAIPTRLNFDERSALPGSTQEISLTGINGGGTYYVFVYGDQVQGSASYTFTAEKAPFFVTGISPTRHGNAVPAIVTLTGAGFDADTSVSFIDADGRTFGVGEEFISSATLKLDDLPTTPGVYAVRVSKGAATFELSNAFEVVQGGQAHLETNLVVPGTVSPGFPVKQTLCVEYRNTGDIAMPAPLLQVVANQNGLLTANGELANSLRIFGRPVPNGLGGSVQRLATGSGATPGILQPGESGRIPVYYVGLSEDHGANQVTFTLGSLTTADTTEQVCYVSRFPLPGVARIVFNRPGHGRRNIDVNAPLLGQQNCFEEYLTIDWINIYQNARPETMPQDAWEATLLNLRAEFGDLWADYVFKMGQNANALGAIGQPSNDIAALWNFEIAQASAALSPVRYFAGAVDVSIPTPGLPLTFSRVYGQDLVSRFRQGTLGPGWSHNWDIRAERLENRDAVLHGPGGIDRFFRSNNDGTFTAAPGDYGKLTLVSGVFKLVETDQTLWQFRADGNLDFVKDSNGNRITLAYSSGRLVTLTHSNGRQILLQYDIIDFGADSRLERVIDTMGPGGADDRVTTFQYDGTREHLTRVIAPGNRATDYTYAPLTLGRWKPTGPRGDTNPEFFFPKPTSHALLSVTHPDETHDYFGYDARGRLLRTSKDGGAESVSFEHPAPYQDPGQVIVADSTGRETVLQFGLGGQLAQVHDGDGRIVGFGYDSRPQFNNLNGPGGERYRYSYDLKGNLIGIQDALNLQTSFEYEPNFNQLAGFADARGNGMDYQYDARGNPTAIVYVDGTRESFTYDAVGNVLTATNRRSQTVAYAYNTAGQVTSKDYPTTPGFIDYVYTYDFAGNLTSATDASDTVLMSYDPQTDLLTRIDYPGGKFFTFAYDDAGRRTRRTDQDGNVVNYIYDSIGRLNRMTDGAGNLIVDYDYDAAGRLSRKTLGNGVYTLYEYDDAGHVLHLVNFRPDNTVLSRFSYSYDASGRRTSMTTLDGTFEYGYDALGQLTSVRHPDGHVVVYDYDEASNRRRVTDDGVATIYTANDLNQYVTVGGATYVHDLDGNLISKTEGGVTTTYDYDIENRLVGVTTPTDAWTYAYDPFGNRIAATHNDATTSYVIDPTGLGNVAAEYDGAGNLLTRYDHGYGLLSRTDGAGAAFYTFQAIGHTSELTGTGGAMLNAYNYDPFGLSLGKTETVANPFEFIGEYGVMNEDNGLEYMRARYFRAEIGRFGQPDRIGLLGGFNLFAYAGNNPLMFVDPSGLDWNGSCNENNCISTPQDPAKQKLVKKIALDIALTLIPWGLGKLGRAGKVATWINEFLGNYLDPVPVDPGDEFPAAPDPAPSPKPDPVPAPLPPGPIPSPTPMPAPSPPPGPGNSVFPVPVAPLP